MLSKTTLNQLSYEVLGSAIEVHRALGPGLLESVYEHCFVHELKLRGISYQTQYKVPLHYKGLRLHTDLRCDVLVEEIIVVELKAIESILPIHESVLLTYMKMLEVPKGLLINFHCKNLFKYGQRSLVNELFSRLPED